MQHGDEIILLLTSIDLNLIAQDEFRDDTRFPYIWIQLRRPHQILNIKYKSSDV